MSLVVCSGVSVVKKMHFTCLLLLLIQRSSAGRKHKQTTGRPIVSYEYNPSSPTNQLVLKFRTAPLPPSSSSFLWPEMYCTAEQRHGPLIETHFVARSVIASVLCLAVP